MRRTGYNPGQWGSHEASHFSYGMEAFAPGLIWLLLLLLLLLLLFFASFLLLPSRVAFNLYFSHWMRDR